MKLSSVIALLCLLPVAAAAAGSDLQLKPGLIITESCKIARMVYSVPNTDDTGKRAAITIRGDNLTVDFAGAALEGTPKTAAPDERKGTGIRLEGRNITIKNAIV